MLPDYVQLAGVAELLGRSVRTVQRYIARGDFPEPAPFEEHLLRTGRTWRRRDVEAWGVEHLPLPRKGRPRKSG